MQQINYTKLHIHVSLASALGFFITYHIFCYFGLRQPIIWRAEHIDIIAGRIIGFLIIDAWLRFKYKQ